MDRKCPNTQLYLYKVTQLTNYLYLQPLWTISKILTGIYFIHDTFIYSYDDLTNFLNYRYEAIPERKSRTSTTSMSSSSSAAKRSQSQPPKSLPPTLNGTSGLANGNGSNGLVNGNGSNGLTAVNGNGSNSMVIQQPAPTIERHKKPSRVPSNGYHTYNSHRSSSQLQYPNESTLDKRNHMRDMKMVSEYFHHQKCT